MPSTAEASSRVQRGGRDRLRAGTFGPAASVLILTAIHLGAVGASADATYSVTALYGPGGSPLYGMGVNASGQVAGFVDVGDSQSSAALTGKRGQGATNLGSFGGSGSSYAHGVDNAGRVTGYATTTGGFIHAFVTAPGGGAMRDLGTLGGTTSVGMAVNNSGQVAGYSTLTISGQTQTHAFVTAHGSGAMQDLGTLGQGTYSAGYSVNASGQVTGYSYLSGDTGYYHAFLTSHGSMKDLGTLAGAGSSVGYGVNDSGQVAGVSYFADGTYHAFLTDASGGTMHDLGTLTPGGDSQADAVNNRGQAVGFATTATGEMDAFVYSNGRMVDLNSLIASDLYVHLVDAMGITDDGDIVTIGIDAFGATESYLLQLQAIPEPASLVLLGLGLAGLATRAVRTKGKGRKD